MRIKEKILLSSLKMIREELDGKGLCRFALPIAVLKHKQLKEILGYNTKVVNKYLLKQIKQ